MYFSQSLFLLAEFVHHNVSFRIFVGRINKIQAEIQIRKMPPAEGGSSRAGLLKRGHSVVAGAR